MRQALLESYNRRVLSNQLLREAIDMSVEEPDHARWHLMGFGGAGEPTVGQGAITKDLISTSAAEVRKQAFILYYSSPFVRGIVRTLRKFIFGKGVKTTLLEENETKKKKAEEYLDLWADTNKWDVIQKESSDRTFRDGELFWHNRWMGKKKVPRLEIIEPDDVCSDKPKASHGIELVPNDPNTIKRYHIRQMPGLDNPIFIKGEDMQHLKINVDSNMKRGRSLFEPVFRYITWHDDWLKSRIVLNKVRSAVALVRHVEGKQQEGELIRKPSSIQNSPEGHRKRAATQRTFRSGTILTAGPGVKYKMLSANLGASDAAQDGRNILLAIAVGVGFPEMFLTGNFENNNYSSSLTAQNPFVREFEDWQDFFDFHIQQEMKRVLELGIEAGLVAKNTNLKVKNEFPPLVYEDFVTMSTALGQLFLNEIISGHTYATRMGFDYEEEQELRQNEQASMGLDDGDFGGGEADEEEEEPLLQGTTNELLPSSGPSLLSEVRKPKGGPRTELRSHLRKQLQNLQFQQRLKAKVMRGEHHTKTAAIKKGRAERRSQRIRKHAGKHNIPIGIDLQSPGQVAGLMKDMATGGSTNVSGYTRVDPRFGPVNVRSYMRRQKVQEIIDSGTNQPSDMKVLGGGVEQTWHGDLDLNGDKVHVAFKTLPDDTKFNRAENELAAIKVAEALGLGDYVVPGAVRNAVPTPDNPNGVKGFVMQFINDVMKSPAMWAKDIRGGHVNHYPTVLKRVFDNNLDLAAKLGVFDYLIGNGDRHWGNWMTDKKSRINLIDHERSFFQYGSYFSSDFGAYAFKKGYNPKIRDMLDKWKFDWKGMESAMKTAGLANNKIDWVRARYDNLIDLADRGAAVSKLRD